MNLFGSVAKFNAGAVYCKSKDTYDKVNNLVESPLEGCCEVYVHENSSILGSN